MILLKKMIGILQTKKKMINEIKKAEELIEIFGSPELAIKCCNEVLSYMGADRGYEFWFRVRELLKTRVNE